MFRELSTQEIIRTLGGRLKQYRLILGYTQQELSVRAGVSVPTIQKLEAGSATNITLSNLLSLMRHLGLIENADGFIPEQPEYPYGKRITKIRHAAKKNH